MNQKERIRKYLKGLLFKRATTKEIFMNCLGEAFDPYALLKEMQRDGELKVSCIGAHLMWEIAE